MTLSTIATIGALTAALIFFIARASYYLSLYQSETDKRQGEILAFDRDRLTAAQRIADMSAQHADDLRHLLGVVEEWREDPHALATDPIGAIDSIYRHLSTRSLLHANRPKHY
ncbi:hypothetical protein NRB36_004304 [Salmonella enterica]|nr:hypothetical protein [Salmonella enterica]EJO1639663.1 hypothetical protein [Salmonella enterica]